MMEANASENISQVNPEFNEVRVNKKLLISYYFGHNVLKQVVVLISSTWGLILIRN